MNPWPVYNFIKRRFFETGRIPTNREIAAAVPEATFEEMREGWIEAELAHRHDWRNAVDPARRQWA